MKIRILTVGKKHEPWARQGIERFLERLRPPFAADIELVPHSGKEGVLAATEESEKILNRTKPSDFIILLDERGENLSSPEFSKIVTDNASGQIVIVIGGAYGTSSELRQRANIVWSLSRLVFPHQLVRLILTEQLYRAQEIAKQGPYHHE